MTVGYRTADAGAATPPLRDPGDLPLFGSRLIEASAGTGKTYTIAGLYLRLVLGHGGERAFDRPLSPPEILVVTFTDAATQELRARIQDRLLEAARHFRGAAPAEPDPSLRRLLDDHPDPGQRAAGARRLEAAAEWMDEAAVSTIHGWCYRMLREHAFDSGSLFDQQLEADLSDLRSEAVRDYWRTMIYPQPPARLGLLCSIMGQDPQALEARIGALLEREPPGAAALPELEALLDRRLDQVAQRKAPWRDDFDAVAESFRAALPALNGNKYRNAEDLLEKMREWSLHPGAEPPHGNLAERFSLQGMRERLKQGRDLPADLHPAFAGLDGYAGERDDTPGQVLAHAAAWVRHRFERERQRRAQLGFEDLLQGLDTALIGPGGPQLAETIRSQFPVAMIDEFQDTDPVQYRIFERIYRVAENRPEQGVFLIGDPKQSIYAFRGADIHSYLRARAATSGRHYTLATNFRATGSFVQACNRLFAHAEGHPQGAFLFRTPEGENPVPFEGVAAHGLGESLRISGQPVPALTLAFVDDGAAVGKGTYLGTMAERCASEMVALLQAGQDGQGGFLGNGGLRPLQPSDLAVLVRNRNEAEAIRGALERRGVRSVYLSDRESVFDTPEAADLLRWLRACAEPESERLLRAALATATLDLDPEQMDRLNHDEAHWEERVLEFREYRRIWREQGVLPMLRRLLHAFELPATLLQRPDRGERALTNLLHLSELLQAAAGELDGEQALIRHLAEHLDGRGAGSDEQILRLESDEGLVQVVTIHKSKGLQYPLVFLPFICTFRQVDGKALPLVYRDDAGQSCLTWHPESAQVELADRERLAEDLRLLYVAVTRARHSCWLGIAPLRVGSGSASQLHLSGFGYLLSGGAEIPPGGVRAQLQRLAGDSADIAVRPVPEPRDERFRIVAAATGVGRAREPLRAAREHWWIASYSALRAADALSGSMTAPPDAADTALEDRFPEIADEPAAGGHDAGDTETGLHRFPRGPEPGTFLHGLLEWAAREGFAAVVRDPALLRDTVARRCRRRGWGHWVEPVSRWLHRLLTEPLVLPDCDTPARLCELSVFQPEMEFWFETHWVDAQRIDRLVRAQTLGGAARPELAPVLLNGMLKGFIDLVFEHEGRYFTLDYKSNWLGPGPAHYAPQRVAAQVLAHRYDLQYLLYTLALHRQLHARLLDYDPDRHLGGALTWFLRGVDAPRAGLHADRPPGALVDALDQTIRSAPDAAAGDAA
ncbi:Exodeoxyribonuclease V beta chain [Thioalkalivibrio nitratireducens DSM 14787]|uniref:RecBCD enzyme subunit RecB n=1 Tax=Thioalkalivibrio nitratireducens (strain DSM 14787 / UNIQEM 213 / ALEN2) TaxID=1255043 RepID=L0DS83_THIND|nr:exodeoxyribonuclease V subunit beta [Thioalkalivibrio nitratireducens]AGA31850.1 Exodeoxyribonuclease V beta chain [Thioalkalivibrio nitratireducens DSM 14787]